MKKIPYLFRRKTIFLRTDLLEISLFLLKNLREFPLDKEFCEEKSNWNMVFSFFFLFSYKNWSRLGFLFIIF